MLKIKKRRSLDYSNFQFRVSHVCILADIIYIKYKVFLFRALCFLSFFVFLVLGNQPCSQEVPTSAPDSRKNEATLPRSESVRSTGNEVGCSHEFSLDDFLFRANLSERMSRIIYFMRPNIMLKGFEVFSICIFQQTNSNPKKISPSAKNHDSTIFKFFAHLQTLLIPRQKSCKT